MSASGTKRTCHLHCRMSAFGGKADIDTRARSATIRHGIQSPQDGGSAPAGR